MAKTYNNIKNSPKVNVIQAIANVKNPELGELFYELANSRLYIWTVAGWKYAGFT